MKTVEMTVDQRLHLYRLLAGSQSAPDLGSLRLRTKVIGKVELSEKERERLGLQQAALPDGRMLLRWDNVERDEKGAALRGESGVLKEKLPLAKVEFEDAEAREIISFFLKPQGLVSPADMAGWLGPLLDALEGGGR